MQDEITAYHEAGHAFAAVYLGAKVRAVSIDPDRDDGPQRWGDTEVVWNRRRFTPSEMAEKMAIVALAGPVAEMIYREQPFHPAFVAEWQLDWQQALSVLEHIRNPGLRIRYLEQATLDLYEVFRDDEHWNVIAAIADQLLAHEILDAELFLEAVEPWLSERNDVEE